MNSQLKVIVATLSTAAMLAGCGGGGSSSAPTAAVAPVAPVVPAVSTIVPSVAASTYGAGSEKRYAYTYLNAQRSACGFGLLQQSTQIDQAAQAHADYFVTNNLTNTHYEDNTNYPTGFTGIAPTNRMTTAGYTSQAGTGEVIAGTVLTYAPTLGQDGVMELFGLPYHGIAQLSGFRDLGIGFNTRNDIVIDFGATSSRPKQQLGATDVVTYPCASTTGVLSRSYSDESPVPIAGRNLQTTPIGHPIYIKVREGQTLTLTSTDLRVQGSGTALALLSLSSANDTNGIFTDQSAIALLPNAPLLINTTYAFTATGTNNGAAVNIAFTFTTGAH